MKKKNKLYSLPVQCNSGRRGKSIRKNKKNWKPVSLQDNKILIVLSQKNRKFFQSFKTKYDFIIFKLIGKLKRRKIVQENNNKMNMAIITDIV